MFQRFRCCECYKVQNLSLSQQVLSKIVGIECPFQMKGSGAILTHFSCLIYRL